MGEANRKKKAGIVPPGFGKPVDMYAATFALSRAAIHRGTTPSTPLSQAVRDFTAALSPGREPVLLPFTEIHADYRAGACHANVVHKVRESKGERVNGWMIWETPLYVEGEFHAVWRSPAGELVDLTPRQDGEEFVLFLPDPNTRIGKAPPEGDVPIVWCPTNRTNIPEAPYTVGGCAHNQPYFRVAHDARTTSLMRTLGVDSIVG